MSATASPPANQQELDLDYTKTKRKNIVEKLLAKAPEQLETKDLSIVLQALDGIDRQALTLTRIKSDEGISNTTATAAEALIRMYMSTDNRRPVRTLEPGEVRVMPELPDGLDDVEVKTGEFDSSVKNESYDQFQRRTKGEPAA